MDISFKFTIALCMLLVYHQMKDGSLAKANVIEADVGESVTMRCKHKNDGSSYSVSWGIDCETEARNTLVGHACYKNRLKFSESNKVITINNLTENDAGLYCCYVEVAGQSSQPADKTRVRVKERQRQAGDCDKCQMKTLVLLMEILRFSSLVILIILVSILIKTSA